MDCLGQFAKEIFRGFHHPVVVFVGDIQFQHSEFWIVRSIHSFIPEVSAELIHAFESAYDEPLEIQFVRNAEIERRVQCVVMRHEWSSCRATWDALEYRSVHLHPPSGVEDITDFTNHRRSCNECVFHVWIDDEIHVALPVAQFGVGEGAVHVPFIVCF